MFAMNKTEQEDFIRECLITWTELLFLKESSQSPQLPENVQDLLDTFKVTIRTSLVSPVFLKLTHYVSEYMNHRGVLSHLIPLLSHDSEAIADLLYLIKFYPQTLSSLTPFSEYLGFLNDHPNYSQMFFNNLEATINRFEANKIEIVKKVTARFGTDSSFREEFNHFSELAKILATDSFAVISGPEFSGKSTLANKYIAHHQSSRVQLTYIVIDSTTESSSLLGNYFITTDEENPQFQWKDGPLVVAVKQGHLCVLENFEMAQEQLKSFFKNLVETRSLRIKNKTVYFHPNFKVLFVTRDSDFLNPLNTVTLSKAELGEFLEITANHSRLPKLFHSLVFRLSAILYSGVKGASYYKMQKLITRLGDIFAPLTQNANGSIFISSEVKLKVLLAMSDIFFEGMSEEFLAFSGFEELAKAFEMSAGEANSMITFHETPLTIKQGQLATLRFSIPCKGQFSKDSSFVLTPKVNIMIEKILGGVKFNENVLLIGETGSGKTTVVQQLATAFGKRLNVFNISHSTDSTDLFGGYRPVNNEVTFKHEIDELQAFLSEFFDLSKNIDFIKHMRSLIKDKKFDAFSKCLVQACRKIISSEYKEATEDKMNENNTEPINEVHRRKHFEECRSKLSKILSKHEKLIFAKQSLNKEQAIAAPKFEFVKGVILQAIERDEWLLLDEINLANDDVLLKLYQLLFNQTLYFMDSNELQSIHKHPQFRLFACMNPAFEVGKKPLPKRIQEGFTAFQVPSVINVEEIYLILSGIFEKYTVITSKILRSASEFYVDIRHMADESKLLDKSQKKLVLSLRQLRRGTNIIKTCLSSKDLSLSVVNAFYIGFRVAFYLDLSESSKQIFNTTFNTKFNLKNIEKLYNADEFLTLSRDFKDDPKRSTFHGHPLPISLKQNSFNTEVEKQPSVDTSNNQRVSHFDAITKSITPQTNYIITHSVRIIILDLLKILLFDESIPILLEGPTSSGKTSLITFLASAFNQKLVRINNHRDTDTEEYIGGYVPDSQGTIRFREGTLIKCMREGSWLLLDELNLARSEILEALNRVLDDNQELYVPEIDQIVKPSPGFRIFATQNPSSYSGRSLLSKAFRNRFVVINFESLDDEDLMQILTTKASIAESRAKIMMAIMQRLQNLRSFEHVFEGKEGLITVRDLLKWSNRKDQMLSKEDLGVEGSLLLGERIRDYEQKEVVQDIIIQETGARKSHFSQVYTKFFDELLKAHPQIDTIAQKHGIKWNKQFKRLFVLAYKAFITKEAILLIGETGCGKTTLAQLFAEIFEVEFYSLNCHKNTEVSDFLGAWRPFRQKSEVVKKFNEAMLALGLAGSLLDEESSKQQTMTIISQLPSEVRQRQDVESMIRDLESEFQWVEGNLVRAARSGGVYLIDEISLANDNVLERLNSLLEFERKIAVQEGNDDLVEITASPNFHIIATMNPSGDHGKRELSPALRNRFTEIWVTSIFDYENYADNNEEEVKMFLTNIIDFNTRKFAIDMSDEHKGIINNLIFKLFRFVNYENHKLMKPLNFRDLFTWITIFAKNYAAMHLAAAKLATDMLFESQLGLITDQSIFKLCTDHIKRFYSDHQHILSIITDVTNADSLSITSGSISIAGITLFVSTESKSTVSCSTSDYVFDEAHVRQNLLKIFLGLQSEKPLLLEGPPGVGKTSLIEQLAKFLNIQIYKINLSEHTDMIDLLGADVPDAKRVGHFTWNDGLLLRALKSGAWIIFDELNLANQTVLEGLNSILDHRGEVFLPDINQTVHKHSNFRFFGTQNPLNHGKGRKGLPLSFLNRFFRIYLTELHSNSLKTLVWKIIDKRHGKLKDFLFLFDLIFSQIESSPIERHELNIRTFRKIINFLDTFYEDQSQLSLLSFMVVELFIAKQKVLIPIAQSVFKSLSAYFDMPIPRYSMIERANNQHLSCRNNKGLLVCQSAKNLQTWSSEIYKEDSHVLWALGVALDLAFPIILHFNTNENTNLVSLIQQMAVANQKRLRNMRMFKSADISDLIGSYEQFNWEYIVMKELNKLKKTHTQLFSKYPIPIETTNKQAMTVLLTNLLNDIDESELNIKQRIEKLIELIEKEKSVFVWSDSELIRAIQKGHWVLIRGCHEANPAVLEKLNGIMEDQHIVLNESFDENNNVREITKHPNFRLILSFENMNNRGELSPALKNRCFVVNNELYRQTRFFKHLASQSINHSNAHVELVVTNYFKQLLTLHSIVPNIFASLDPNQICDYQFCNDENISKLREYQLLLMRKCFDKDHAFPRIEESTTPIDNLQAGAVEYRLLHTLKLYLESLIFGNGNLKTHPWIYQFDIAMNAIRNLLVSNILSVQIYNEKILTAKFESIEVQKESLSLQAMIKASDYKFISDIHNLMSFNDYSKLESFIELCGRNIITRSQQAQLNNSIALESEENKFMLALFVRTLSSLSPDSWIFVDKKESPEVHSFFADIAFRNKANFVEEVSPAYHRNFRAILVQIYKALQSKEQVKQTFNILETRENAADSNFGKIEHFVVEFSKTVESKFTTYLHAIKENIFTVFDVDEDENFLLLCQNSEVLPIYKAFVKNFEFQSITEIEQFGKTLGNDFKNVIELFEPFSKLFNVAKLQEMTRFNAEERLSDQFDIFNKGHFLQVSKHLVSKLGTSTKTNLTVSEVEIAHLILKDLAFDFKKRVTKATPVNSSFFNTHSDFKDILHNAVTQLRTLDPKKALDNVNEVSFEEFLMCIKYSIKQELDILALQIQNVMEPYDSLEVSIAVESLKANLQAFLEKLSYILEKMISRTIFFNARKGDFSGSNISGLISELVYNNGRNRVLSAYKKPNTMETRRIEDFLSYLLKFANSNHSSSSETEELIQNIISFYIDCMANYQLIFNEVLSRDLFEYLAKIVSDHYNSQIRIFTGFTEIQFDGSSENLQENIPLLVMLHEAKFCQSTEQIASLTEMILRKKLKKIEKIDLDLNESFKEVNKKSFSEAARALKLEAHFEKLANYEYEKQTVQKNREKLENEFKENFNLFPSEDFIEAELRGSSKLDKNEGKSFWKIKRNFNKSCEAFWKYFIINNCEREHWQPNHELAWTAYIALQQILKDVPLSASMQSNIILSITADLINGKKVTDLGLSQVKFKAPSLTTDPRQEVLLFFVEEKIKMKSTSNFYEDSFDISNSKTLGSLLQDLITALKPFYLDTAFRDLPSFVAILKACKIVSKIKATSSPAQLATSTELLIRNLNEFNNSLPATMKLSQNVQKLTKLLVELRRIERHSWKNFVLIKRHEKMNEDFISLIKFFPLLETASAKEKLVLIDSYLKESTLLTFPQRCAFVNHFASDIKEPKIRRIALNIVRYYAAYYDQYQEAISLLAREVEEPMRNASKLMNWHFEDIVSMRLNIEKFYRAINRCIKAQEEAYGANFFQHVIVTHRAKLLFESVKSMKDNLSAILISDKKNVTRKVVSRKTMETILAASSDFKSIEGLEPLSYFRIVSAKKLCLMLNGSKTSYIPRYKADPNSKKALSLFMKNYLQRMEELQAENNRSYKLRALIDFLKDLGAFGLKSRINFNREMTYGNIFQGNDLISINDFPVSTASQELKSSTLAKLRKLNIRFCRIIDVLKTYLDNCSYSQELEAVFREKLMSNLFSLFVKYTEHQKMVKAIINMVSKIVEVMNCLNAKNQQDCKKILFIIENNLKMDQIDGTLSKEERSLLEKVSLLVQSGRYEECRTVLLNENSQDTEMQIEKEYSIHFTQIRAVLLGVLSDIFNRSSNESQSLHSKLGEEYTKARRNFKAQMIHIDKSSNDEASNLSILDIEMSLLKSILNFTMNLKKSVITASEANEQVVKIPREAEVLLSHDLTSKIVHVIDWLYVFNKFLYFCSITFTNLIYKGFCTVDQNEKQKPIKGDEFETELGTGIGEGKGEENVTGEMDFEEQVLGLKNEQKEQGEENEEQEDLEADEEEMEMENDFEGTTDRKKKEKEDQNGEDNQEEPKDDPNKAQDEFDKVEEDELDYKLFQDESEEEEEEQEQQDKEGLREADNLELRAEDLKKENEKQQAKEDEDDKDVRNLNKEGVEHEDDVSELTLKTDEEKEDNPDDSVEHNEEFNQNLPEENPDGLDENSENPNPEDEQNGSFEMEDAEIGDDMNNFEEEVQDNEIVEEQNLDIPDENQNESPNQNEAKDKEDAFEALQEQEALNQNDQQTNGANQRKEKAKLELQENEENMKDEAQPLANDEAQEKKLQEKIQSIFSQDQSVNRNDIQQLLENINIEDDDNDMNDDDANENDTNANDYTLEKQPEKNKRSKAQYSKLKAYDKKQPKDEANDLNELEDLPQPDVIEEKPNQPEEQKDSEDKKKKLQEKSRMSDKFSETLLQKRPEPETELQNAPYEPIPNTAKKIKPDQPIAQAHFQTSFADILKEFSAKEHEKIDSAFDNTNKESLVFLHTETNRLCEELKAILEQKKLTDLKGDYRTGKRLNIKRIISYIASNYRKDKIWLRRTEPSERDYRILVAVDDSLSMK